MKVFIKPILFTAILGILFFLGFKYLGTRSESDQQRPAVALLDKMEKQGLPAIEDKTREGKAVRTVEMQGKLLIINFWASWCGPCVEEIPSLIKLVEEFKGEVQVIAISEDNSLEEMNDFLKAFPKIVNPNIHVIFDESKKYMEIFKTERLPESFISDKEHKLVKKIVGKVEWHTNDSIEFFKGLLK